MSVSATFNKSKTNQLINFILEKYGKEDEYDIIIQHALQEEWIKTAKPRNTTGDATTTARKSAEKGQSKWTAYQRWAKKWSAWNDTPIDRDTMKEIYAGYDEDELKEWARVADELNAGKDIRDIENKPEIRMPKPKQQDEASSQETVQDEFEAADLNKDGVLSKEEFEAHQAKKQDEELSDVEKLKAQLAAAEAKIAEK
tara:strand:- start:419 stop:1015 length:597 start_codon:yes stop_codon:yes gene_type:complete